MEFRLDDKLVVAISSRALFDLEDGHRVFTEQGVDAYCHYQMSHENEILEPGVAFGLVRKLLALNHSDRSRHQVEVVLISRNSADTGLRIFNSISHYGLKITRAAFSGGASPFSYVAPFNADLFLSADPHDVRSALDAGIAAATIMPSKIDKNIGDQLRIAFDGDAVLFADDSERVFQDQGLAAFAESERNNASTPMIGGPFRHFLAVVHQLQSDWPQDQSPIRTALFTARSAPAHERVIRTLRAWDIRIDEAVFLGGLDKGAFLDTFGADIYFDDQQAHCDSARQYVPTGHVPHGVTNNT
ncbi:MAG: 5'-nucleotidase [Proteobacteria bacterium]|jgi:5'-nucleotidase|nr:5'-nucleotidase [Pseudomonadota bacterium]MBP09028.1 5'-nucleotidase [Acidiferrobacteraceae bacterium]MDP6136330.1 5'-nucleotidase [Arenicellales bacterium]HCF73265.1 5'-nucleotidase [Gammaproteobacteria bacterium]MDP6392832.1 5'-nucleotidase [Arenicellales bacterium]|tara:strand:- start:2725 stop:3627 length:903 start_codon:yes stop_codon:yes gene_type:complete